mgnify:FL=1
MSTFSSREGIIEYLQTHRQATVPELVDYLSITRQALHRQLRRLVERGELHKLGSSPRVFYTLPAVRERRLAETVSETLRQTLEENFLLVTPGGILEAGLAGFSHWCERQRLPFARTVREYLKTLTKYQAYKKNGLINGMFKVKQTFLKVFLDKLFYLDFYSLERFGKTRLGQLLLYAKQSQNRNLTKQLATEIKPRVIDLIKRYRIEAVGFIPPTVRREVQLMRELERRLDLPLPSLELVKVQTPVAVPQKTLSKLADRVENARETIVVAERRQFDRILLLDDALGSGATLNETARKLKDQKVAKVVIGLAITGSFSGFEVISEV